MPIRSDQLARKLARQEHAGAISFDCKDRTSVRRTHSVLSLPEMTEPPKCSLCKLVEGKSPVRSSGKTIYDHAQADCQPLNRRQVPHTNSPPSRYPLPRSVASSVCSTHTELAPQAGLSQGGGPRWAGSLQVSSQAQKCAVFKLDQVRSGLREIASDA